MLVNYKEYEKQVYDWLMTKHQNDTSFTFSVRRNGVGDAKNDYFIGTEKSKYFSTTFWTLPGSYPGSSGDNIGLIFHYTKTGYNYFIEFNQTKAPHDAQNQSILSLLESMKPAIEEKIGLQSVTSADNKMYTLKTKTHKSSVETIEEMLEFVDKDIAIVIPIVNDYIQKEKAKNKDFVANRITVSFFESMIEKMGKRFEKYSDITPQIILLDDTKKENIKSNIDDLNIPLNQILYGPPGTGKTYKTKELVVEIANNKLYKSISSNLSEEEKRTIILNEYDSLFNAGQIVFTTFHQSMSYEDFVEGIKPETVDKRVTYDTQPGIFKELCDVAKDNWFDNKIGLKKALSFDEALFLLKEDWEENNELKFPLKRAGNDFTIIGFTKSSIQFKKASGGTGHTLSISTLRDYYYSQKEVRLTGVGIYYPSILEKLKSYQPKQVLDKKVKPFVLVIDEINRGNVSSIFGELITLLEEDKRIDKTEEVRIKLTYSKEEDFGIPPNLYIIGTMNTADRSVEALDTALRRRFCFTELMPEPQLLEGITFSSFSLKEVLETINARIVVLLDRDHTIGHSYFLQLKSNDVKGLKAVFENNIIPLLQEYFYHDYEKIALVLGEGFVSLPTDSASKVRFAKFSATQLETPDNGKRFELKKEFTDIEAAIEMLLNRE
jgi:Cdc6-like AAA superfamily ATPase